MKSGDQGDLCKIVKNQEISWGLWSQTETDFWKPFENLLDFLYSTLLSNGENTMHLSIASHLILFGLLGNTTNIICQFLKTQGCHTKP